MKNRFGYISNSSSTSYIIVTDPVQELREERKKKLENLQKIIKDQKDVVSLHDEIFQNSK